MSQKSGKKKAKRRYRQWISRSGVTRHNLITFGRLDDDSLPSDDSEDSTYQPMPTETSDDLGKKRKRSK